MGRQGTPTGWLVMIFGFLVACSGEALTTGDVLSNPELLPLDRRQVAVNETLVLSLAVDNPKGLPLVFSWTGPDLPGLDRTVRLSGTPHGGEFSYSPLSSHVGEHEFVIQIAFAAGFSQQSFRVKVAPATSAAPVFLRPGAGGTFDLTRTSCVSFDIEVRDDDSAEVTITAESGMPDGGDIVATGPKSAHFDWCPTPGQVDASDRWPLLLRASDAEHEPTDHGYLILLRRQSKAGCPGDPPVVTITAPGKGEKVVSSSGYDVSFSVTDDKGLRDAPVLYWTTAEQEDLDHPDLSEFQMVLATASGAGFKARVPSLGLAQGEERVVFVVASATDNDDSGGTACDHRTDTSVHRFIAKGSDTGGSGESSCSPCDHSTDCHAGPCALTPAGSVCLPQCGSSTCRTEHLCRPVTSIEGAVVQTCGTLAEVCPELAGGGTDHPSCVPDAYESNDTVGTARLVGAGVLQGTLCAGDADFFLISVPGSTLLTLTLSPLDASTGDLDLQLRDTAGTILGVSAGAGADESLKICLSDPGQRIAEVLGYAGQTGGYRLSVGFSSQSCCVDDPAEPDDSASQASVLPLPGLGEGTICPYNSDYFRLSVPSAGQVSLVLASMSPDADLDLVVYGPTGAVAASGETAGDEEVSWQAVQGMHYVRVFGFLADMGDYLLEATFVGHAGCSTHMQCPIGTVCGQGSCTDGYCLAVSDCPQGYGCPVPGPVDDLSMCGAPCTTNSNCRAEEACKFFYEGRFCGLKGTGANGAPCQVFSDCGGQRACIPWPKGYCARDRCTKASDCESGTYCVPVLGVGACVVDCWPSDSICRLSDGYMCDLLPDITGTQQFVCVP
jgi:hypothetical protein